MPSLKVTFEAGIAVPIASRPIAIICLVSWKAAVQSRATDAATDALTRCRASQRRFRNTLIFVAADEGLLATARSRIT